MSMTDLPFFTLGFLTTLKGLSPPMKVEYLAVEFQVLTSVMIFQSILEPSILVMEMSLVEGGI